MAFELLSADRRLGGEPLSSQQPTSHHTTRCRPIFVRLVTLKPGTTFAGTWCHPHQDNTTSSMRGFPARTLSLNVLGNALQEPPQSSLSAVLSRLNLPLRMFQNNAPARLVGVLTKIFHGWGTPTPILEAVPIRRFTKISTGDQQ